MHHSKEAYGCLWLRMRCNSLWYIINYVKLRAGHCHCVEQTRYLYYSKSKTEQTTCIFQKENKKFIASRVFGGLSLDLLLTSWYSGLDDDVRDPLQFLLLRTLFLFLFPDSSTWHYYARERETVWRKETKGGYFSSVVALHCSLQSKREDLYLFSTCLRSQLSNTLSDYSPNAELLNVRENSWKGDVKRRRRKRKKEWKVGGNRLRSGSRSCCCCCCFASQEK